jgi:hypothetical protein
VIQNPSSPASPALLRESRSALVQTDGDELPRRAPSPRAQSTRQAINDAYNSSLPTSRHVHVLSVAPGAPAASEHMDSAGLMEARSVAVMRGQPPVVVEDTLSPGNFFVGFSVNCALSYSYARLSLSRSLMPQAKCLECCCLATMMSTAALLPL